MRQNIFDRRNRFGQRSKYYGVAALALFFATVGGLAVIYTERTSSLGTVDGPAATTPKDQFEERIEKYLLNNPEVIVRAMDRLQQRQREAEQAAAKTALVERREEIFNDPTSPIGGNRNGDVTLVEFFDYNCPYCRRVIPTIAEIQSSDPKLRIVYKEFPILGPNSTYAARAALAADRQGKYLPFHKALMQLQGTIDETRVLAVAKKIGLDPQRLTVDMVDPAIQETLDRNVELARALNINGTPAFIVGEAFVPGAVDLKTLQSLVREARNSK